MTTLTDQWDDPVGLATVSEAEALVIQTPEDYEKAVRFRFGLKGFIEAVETRWAPVKAAARKIWQGHVDEEKRELDVPKQALKIINDRLLAYEINQKNQQRIAEARAAQEAAATGVMVPASSVAEVPKIQGFTFSLHYKAVVQDKVELIKQVAQGHASSDLLVGNQPMLDDWARQLGPVTKASESPGTVVPMPGLLGVGIVAEKRARG